MDFGYSTTTMTHAATSRKLAHRHRARLSLLAALMSVSLPLAFAHAQPPAPIERRAPQPLPNAPVPSPSRPGTNKPLNGQHLSTWFDAHSNQTTAQRLQALEKEPGFHDLPPATQQRMRDRLLQLGNMPPEKRARIISNNEAIEHLTPDQRQQIRSSMQQLSALPPASRRAVQRTFRTLRGLPPAQRLAYLNSPDIRSQFTEQERNTLSSLMNVEHFLPQGTSAEPPRQ